MEEKDNKTKKKKKVTPEDILKMEIASELGLSDKIAEYGWKSLTSRESGKIGGIMAKRKKNRKNNPD